MLTSFPISLKNPPAVAAFWMPVVYQFNPETGSYTSYYPPDYLALTEKWTCPLIAGGGILVDIRAIVYDSGHSIIDTKDQNDVLVKDGQEFVFYWSGAGGGMLKWVIGVGALTALVIVIVDVARKK